MVHGRIHKEPLYNLMQGTNQSHTSNHRRHVWQVKIWLSDVFGDRTNDLQITLVGERATSGLYMMLFTLEALFETEQRPCATHLLSVSGAERGAVPFHLLAKSENTQHRGPKQGLASAVPCWLL